MEHLERALALLHELEQDDEEKGALLLEVHFLLERVRMVEGTAWGVQQTRATLPARRESAEADMRRARDEADAARAALAVAQEAVRSARKDERRTGELSEVRARDRLSVAERRVADVETELDEIERLDRGLVELAAKLQADGKALAEALRNRPRIAEAAGAQPAPELDGLLGWAETARAALLVARAQLAAEGDDVIRQANELGAVVLGELLTSARPAVIARRVEEELSD